MTFYTIRTIVGLACGIFTSVGFAKTTVALLSDDEYEEDDFDDIDQDDANTDFFGEVETDEDDEDDEEEAESEKPATTKKGKK